MADIVGKTIGNYQIIEKLGQGSMGVVFRAKQISMDRDIALKVLPTKLAQDEKYVERFITEARAAGQLSHPNIVGVYDVVKFGNTYAFSMDFVDGMTAQEMIDAEGALEEKKALGIAKDIASGLGEAHLNGILHRDVKPDNFMIDMLGRAKLADLGLARTSTPNQGKTTTSGESIGTPYYMAPEEARAQTVDTRADLYSLGASLFHMVTGRVPYEGPTAASVIVMHATEKLPDPRSIHPDVSSGCSKLIRRLMSKTPDNRPRDARAVVASIEKLLSGDAGFQTAKRQKVGMRTRTTGGADSAPSAPPWLKIGIIAASVAIVVALVGILYASNAKEEARIARRRKEVRLAEEQAKTAAAEKERKEKNAALKARRAYLAIERWGDDNPAGPEELRKRYRDYLEKYPLSMDVEAAKKKIGHLKGAIADKRAADELDRLVQRARARAATGKYGEAVAMLQMAARAGNPLAPTAAKARSAILDQAVAHYRRLKVEADRLADSGDFVRAKAKLRPVIEDFGMGALATSARNVCADYDSLAAEAELTADRKAFAEAGTKAGAFAKSRRYAEARDAILAAVRKMDNEKLKTLARQVAGDYDCAHNAFAKAKMRLEAGSRTKLALVGLRTGKAVAFVDAGLKISRRGAETIVPWRKLSPSSIAKLVERNIGTQEGSHWRDAGILAMMIGAWPESKAMLTKALDLDPTLQKDVARCLKTVQPQIMAADEKAARKMFKEANAYAEKKLIARTAALAKKLKNDYGHTEFVKSNTDEIEGLLRGKPIAVAGAGNGGGGTEANPNSAAAQLRKLGWKTVKGDWKIVGKGLYEGKGNIRLETGEDWRNAVVSADIQLVEGNRFSLLVRYNPGISTFSNAPPGYGVVVEKTRVRVVSGSWGFSFSFSGSSNGRPEFNRSVTSNALQGHNYWIFIQERVLSMTLDKVRLFKHQLGKHETGTVVLYGTDVTLRIRSPMPRQLP